MPSQPKRSLSISFKIPAKNSRSYLSNSDSVPLHANTKLLLRKTLMSIASYLPLPLLANRQLHRFLALKASPDGWVREAIKAYHRHHADRIVAEVSSGGALVEATVRMIDQNVSYRAVHASRGKGVARQTNRSPVRAAPRTNVGTFPMLEDQCRPSPATLIGTGQAIHLIMSTPWSGLSVSLWSSRSPAGA